MIKKFALPFVVVTYCLCSCKKEASGTGSTITPPTDTIVVMAPATDPPLAATMGFFLSDWGAKNFTAPAYTYTTIPPSAGITVNINRSAVITKIPRSIFGNNANPYMTQMVDQPVLLNHITNLNPHIIRFPGGNISSVYFWNRSKDTPPTDVPQRLVESNGNKSEANYWFGKNTESWTLSLDNYYNMLQQTGNKGMITVNYGYARYGTGTDPVAAAAHLAADWVRYDKGRTAYWEIGNESNGEWQAGYRIDVSENKDGQPEKVTGNLYGKHFNVFADSMRKAAAEGGHTIYIGAQLLEKEPASWQTETDKSWNSGVLSQAANAADYYIVHNYYTNYNTNASAAEILNTATVVTKEMMHYLKNNLQANGASLKPIALTEWNIFSTGSQQMVSHVNGMHAVLVLGELLKNQFGMASRWDLANAWDNGNDHGTFSQGDDGTPKWTPRPSFYHMYFFKKLLGDRMVTSTVTDNNVESYASSFASGAVGVTLVNKSTVAKNVKLLIENFIPGARFYWYTLTGGGDNGEFSRKVFVNGKGPEGIGGGPSDYQNIKAYAASAANGIRVTLPPRSVVVMAIDKK